MTWDAERDGTRLILYSRGWFTRQLVRRAQASGVILRTASVCPPGHPARS